MLTLKERINLQKIEARLRKEEIKRKNMRLVAKTGNANLSSAFDKIQNKLIRSKELFGYVVELNKAA